MGAMRAERDPVSDTITQTAEDVSALQAQIRELAAEKSAVILAHNYQIAPVQDVADYLGDSLGLAQQAETTDARVIIFCGVHFMAETAKILSPEKKVLLPDLKAGCFLSDMIDAQSLAAWKEEYPDAIVVSYVNTTADVKALSDYCCTSSNALKVVESIPPEKEILFTPDMFLGSWVKEVSGRENMRLWPGECHVHSALTLDMILERAGEYPEAEVMVHPECRCSATLHRMISEGDPRVEGRRVLILSTGTMVKNAAESSAQQFVVATETGILHRMKKENPSKEFIPVTETSICQYMKRITLPKVLTSLEEEVYEITVPPDIAAAAMGAVDRMVAIT